MVSVPEERLIIFTRYPEPGKTKTRLIPVLGPEGAADLQRRMAERVLNSVDGLRCAEKISVEVRFEGGSRAQMRTWLGADVLLTAQESGSLDRRMRVAFEEAFADGCRAVVIIGTDIPGITAAIVADAFDRLREKDLVLGPAADGGYYLIGLHRDSLDRARPLLSDAVAWGTERVLQMTLAIAEQRDLSYALVERLQDIDRPEDLPVWENADREASHGDPGQRISVIIPALDESDNIGATLRSLQDAENVEMILADGGSRDGTPEIARKLGASVVSTPPGRAVQMNAGAAAAAGGILLFLHADTKLPPGFENHVRRVAGTPGVSAGAFTLRIDSPAASLRIMERGANLRSRYARMPYGDQGIFMRAAVFREVGGFVDLPIMEDYDLIRRLRRKGRIEIAPAAVLTSARRWLSVGIWRTWWINQAVMAGYHLGVSPKRLAAFYRRAKGIG